MGCVNVVYDVLIKHVYDMKYNYIFLHAVSNSVQYNW